MRRRVLIPEVIQTSAMDCGPAALKALFGGFGIYLSYGRLREACQTDVDGTSIDTLEEVGNALGLELEQRLIPADLLLRPAVRCLPAIVAVRLPDGAPHFVVLWRVHGSHVQLMDPAAGRIWMRRRAFLDSLYVHEQRVPQSAWDEWSRGQDWGPELADLAGEFRLELDDAEPESVRIHGAVIVTATGRRTDTSIEELPASLAAVRREPPPRPWAPVWAAIREGSGLLPSVIAIAILAAAAGTVFEVVLFRGLFDLAAKLTEAGQRAAALAMVVAFAAGLLAIEWPAAFGLLRCGRHLEVRLRAQFLAQVPRLADRYFQSRLISDMAFRAHTLQLLRQLPELAGQFVRLTATLVFTALAILWFYPGSAWPACLSAVLAVAVPLLFMPALVERDLRHREMSGALGRFHLDALRGSGPIKAHGAEATLRAAYAPQLARWAGAGLRQQRLFVQVDAVQMALSLAPVVWLVTSAAGRDASAAGVLLLIYWALSIPATGRQLASIVLNAPALRNTLVRFLEPLASPTSEREDTPPSATSTGVAIDFAKVAVTAGGHVVLRDIDVHVDPGEHIAIVGPSGSGKSSLVGLLLGWHEPHEGSIRIDGVPLMAGSLDRLRRDTAWIDPQVHLFRATLFENLRYGHDGDAPIGVEAAANHGDLSSLLQRLPDGLQSQLGEGGALLSGGEGQRVRIERGLARTRTRLAILDEPATGLDRAERGRLLAGMRERFADATLLAITHDISDTLDFDRVLVMGDGTIVEHGPPRELAARAGSRYRALLDAERDVRRDVWAAATWRRLTMTSGAMAETPNRGRADRPAEVRRWNRA